MVALGGVAAGIITQKEQNQAGSVDKAEDVAGAAVVASGHTTAVLQTVDAVLDKRNANDKGRRLGRRDRTQGRAQAPL